MQIFIISLITIAKNWETTQMSNSKGVESQGDLCAYNGMPLNAKDAMSQKHAEQKKPDSRVHPR